MPTTTTNQAAAHDPLTAPIPTAGARVQLDDGSEAWTYPTLRVGCAWDGTYTTRQRNLVTGGTRVDEGWSREQLRVLPALSSDCDYQNARVEALIDTSAGFTEHDFADLALAAADQAMCTVEEQADIRRILDAAACRRSGAACRRSGAVS